MSPLFADAHDLPVGYWRWSHFQPAEMCDPSGELLVEPALMDKLEQLREDCGFPLPISSGYRTAAHSVAVGGSATDPHTLGLAVDIAIGANDRRAYYVLRAAFLGGWAGIEVKGDHIHVDMAPSRPDAPRPLFFGVE